MRRVTLVAVMLAGCLPAADDDGKRPACESTDDCNASAGEVCDLGVCWGDPPAGSWSAVLAPPSELRNSLVKTAIPELTMTPDGTLADGVLVLDAAVRVRGTVSVPCPPTLPGCVGRRGLPGQLRFGRPSGFVGGPRLIETADVDGEGRYSISLARPAPGAPVTYTATFTPALPPLASGLPSPAELLAPTAREVTLTSDDRDPASGDITLDLELDPAEQRTVSGQLLGTAAVLGWRITAEVVTNASVGARQVVSTTAVVDADGGFVLRVPPEVALVDLVSRPPPSIDPEQRPIVIVRDVILSERLPDLEVPPVSDLTRTRFVVRGVDSSGAAVAVDGATVVVRLDYPLGGGKALTFELRGTTVDGVVELPLFGRAGGAILPYAVDVIPASGSEFAARYGAPLVVGTGPLTLDLSRRVRISGRLRDADGETVAGAAITATVAPSSMCALSSQAARLLLGQAPAQITTNNRGEFALYVDGELGQVPLSYDLTVRPSDGEPRPEWVFAERAAEDAEGLDLTMPAGAHVRAQVVGDGPVAEATVTLFERLDAVPTCGASLGEPGVAVARGRGVSDVDGWVAVVLPRK